MSATTKSTRVILTIASETKVASATVRDVFQPSMQRMEVSGLRINNERAVLTAIATNPGHSAAEVARATGLGAQSVSRILVELETAGLVRRGEARRGQRGQPATPLYIDPNGVFVLGCEIGWRHYHILIRNFGGQVLGEHRRDYAYPDVDVVIAEIGSLARLLMGLVPPEFKSRIIGMGLAMPSGIGRNIDLVGGSAEQAQRWLALDVKAAAEAASGLKVYPFNDGNVACWAELAALPPPRPANMAYFQVGTFVGAGLIAEGRLWEGPTGNSANLGSMLVNDRNGREEFVHLIASLYALERRIAAAGLPVPTGNPQHWPWDDLEPVVSDWLDDAAKALATVIANTHAVMEFSVALLDGDMPRAVVERLVKRVQEYSEALPVLTSDRPRIEIGRLGGSAAARGAALKPIYRRYYSRDPKDFNLANDPVSQSA